MATYNKTEQELDANCPRVEKTDNALKNEVFRDIDVSGSAPRSKKTIEPAVPGETMASLGAATGAASGAVIGGAIGWLMGMSLLWISVIEPFTWTGPLVAAFAGFAAGGLIGGLGGALIGMFIPDLEASSYTGSIKEGIIFLSEHPDERDWGEKGIDRSMEMQINRWETSENSERNTIHWGQGSVERRKTVRRSRTAKDYLLEGL